MKKIQSFKKYSIGFILGISIAVGTTYAANNGSIGALFQYLSGTENGNAVTNVWRLEGENIKDGTVTSYEIKDGTITSTDINTTFISTIQQSITGTCGINSSIRVINSDGSVVCEVDTDTRLSETTVENYLANDTSTNYVTKDVGTKLGNSSIYDNGNVGIGTTSPGAKLHVNGTIKSNGVNVSNSKITNLATPTLDYDAATKKYVDDKLAAALTPPTIWPIWKPVQGPPTVINPYSGRYAYGLGGGSGPNCGRTKTICSLPTDASNIIEYIKRYDHGYYYAQHNRYKPAGQTCFTTTPWCVHQGGEVKIKLIGP